MLNIKFMALRSIDISPARQRSNKLVSALTYPKCCLTSAQHKINVRLQLYQDLCPFGDVISILLGNDAIGRPVKLLSARFTD